MLLKGIQSETALLPNATSPKVYSRKITKAKSIVVTAAVTAIIIIKYKNLSVYKTV